LFSAHAADASELVVRELVPVLGKGANSADDVRALEDERCETAAVEHGEVLVDAPVDAVVVDEAADWSELRGELSVVAGWWGAHECGGWEPNRRDDRKNQAEPAKKSRMSVDALRAG
jgi:hypothetical protein